MTDCVIQMQDVMLLRASTFAFNEFGNNSRSTKTNVLFRICLLISGGDSDS